MKTGAFEKAERESNATFDRTERNLHVLNDPTPSPGAYDTAVNKSFDDTAK